MTIHHLSIDTFANRYGEELKSTLTLLYQLSRNVIDDISNERLNVDPNKTSVAKIVMVENESQLKMARSLDVSSGFYLRLSQKEVGQKSSDCQIEIGKLCCTQVTGQFGEGLRVW